MKSYDNFKRAKGLDVRNAILSKQTLHVSCMMHIYIESYTVKLGCTGASMLPCYTQTPTPAMVQQ